MDPVVNKEAFIAAMKGFSNQEKLSILTELRAADGWWSRNKWWIATTGAIVVSTLLAIFLTKYFFIQGEEVKK